MALLVGQENDIVLALLIVTEFREGLVKGARVQIDHQGAERRAVRVQAGHLAAMGRPQSMQAVNDINVQIEEGIAARVTVQRILDQPLGGRDLYTERLGKRL